MIIITVNAVIMAIPRVMVGAMRGIRRRLLSMWLRRRKGTMSRRRVSFFGVIVIGKRDGGGDKRSKRAEVFFVKKN
jgi:hypothetical protein